MSEPTCQTLCHSGADCLSGVRAYLPGTVLQWCRLFKPCRNLPAGHCVTVVQAVKVVSEPTWRALCGVGCLSNVRTYLQGTVLQWYRLFKQCQNLPTGYCFTGLQTVKPCRNLPAGHCVSVVQAVKVLSEPTWRALCNRVADCLSGTKTYLLGTVLLRCRLFKRCQNLPTGHCVTVVQAVKVVSEPTCLELCYSGADCLSNVRTYLLGTVLQWCRLFKWYQNLPAGHCVAALQTV